MTTLAGSDALQLARVLRHQSFGRGRPEKVTEPVVEPLWSGLRVIAAAQGGTGVLLDDGTELAEHEHLAQALAHAVAATASGVIVDAYVTKQVANDQPGVYTGAEDDVPAVGAPLVGGLLGRGRRSKREQLMEDRAVQLAAEQFEDDDPVNLVAVDLLWLDGEWLLDAPLLERKRLLEAILPGDPLVRPSMFVRPPIERWVGSWRAQGFRGLAFKGANSRYRPGEVASDWITHPMPRR